ncbi:Mis12-domain-containing protein [Flagelloscypha sp. PMI_526]|nr:Mis12-domain-containing protein [Flagelloscypha sp. PMI_526]
MTDTQSKKRLLLAEILGFSPALMLDDIVDITTNTSYEAIRAMEQLIETWGNDTQSHKKPHTEAQISAESRDGIAVFESLIVNVSDTAVDSFENWCQRNVFDLSLDLPYVLPKQEGAQMDATPEKEQELLRELDELREKIHQRRLLKRFLLKLRQRAASARRDAERHLHTLSSLATHESLHTLPNLLPRLHEAMNKLPPLDDQTLQFLATCAANHPGQRPWETSKTGYINWASAQLMNRAKERNAVAGEVDDMVKHAQEVGTSDELRDALDIVDAARESLGGSKDLGEDVEMI